MDSKTPTPPPTPAASATPRQPVQNPRQPVGPDNGLQGTKQPAMHSPPPEKETPITHGRQRRDQEAVDASRPLGTKPRVEDLPYVLERVFPICYQCGANLVTEIPTTPEVGKFTDARRVVCPNCLAEQQAVQFKPLYTEAREAARDQAFMAQQKQDFDARGGEVLRADKGEAEDEGAAEDAEKKAKAEAEKRARLATR